MIKENENWSQSTPNISLISFLISLFDPIFVIHVLF